MPNEISHFFRVDGQQVLGLITVMKWLKAHKKPANTKLKNKGKKPVATKTYLCWSCTKSLGELLASHKVLIIEDSLQCADCREEISGLKKRRRKLAEVIASVPYP